MQCLLRYCKSQPKKKNNLEINELLAIMQNKLKSGRNVVQHLGGCYSKVCF